MSKIIQYAMSNVVSNLFDALVVISDRIEKGFTKATSYHDKKALKALIDKGRKGWSYRDAMTAFMLYQSYKSRVPFGQGIGQIYRPLPKDFDKSTSPPLKELSMPRRSMTSPIFSPDWARLS